MTPPAPSTAELLADRISDCINMKIYDVGLSVDEKTMIVAALRAPAGNGMRERNYTMSAMSVCIGVADEIACEDGTANDVAHALRIRAALASPPSEATASPSAEPVARKTLAEFKEFLTDLADLSIDDATQVALLAAREYIAEDDNPKSNRVLGLIAAALNGTPPSLPVSDARAKK